MYVCIWAASVRVRGDDSLKMGDIFITELKCSFYIY